MNRETQMKGFLAEHKFVEECAKRNIPVSRPLWDLRYDFIVEDKGSLLKVQVKYIGRRKTGIKSYDKLKDKGVICVNAYSVNNSRAAKKMPYTKEEIDVIAAWSEEVEKFLWIPIESLEGKATKHFKITELLVKQGKGKVTYARDYYW
tara:strand:- start:176 stop:619 length:444 start_codon:yes stop_codon:yes gene_type:complete